jgi:hypothetical protein
MLEGNHMKNLRVFVVVVLCIVSPSVANLGADAPAPISAGEMDACADVKNEALEKASSDFQSCLSWSFNSYSSFTCGFVNQVAVAVAHTAYGYCLAGEALYDGE